jgi:hypothetical protein
VIGIGVAISIFGATLPSISAARADDARAPASRGPKPAARCAARPAATGDRATPAEADVATLFAEYQCWLGVAEFRAALEALERACAGSEDAACAFNRALVHHAWLEVPDERDGEHCQTARSNYASYLALEPYEEQSDAARSALDELAGFCEPEAAAPSVEPPVDPDVIAALGAQALGTATSLGDTTPARHDAPAASVSHDGNGGAARAPLRRSPPERSLAEGRPRTLPWLLLGAGSASALATAVAWLNMARADADLSRRTLAGVVYSSPETRALDASRRRYQSWVWGFGVSAVALLGAGTTLLLLDPALPPYLSVSVAPGLAVVGYDATF